MEGTGTSYWKRWFEGATRLEEEQKDRLVVSVFNDDKHQLRTWKTRS
jgi:hypothetical protein